MIKGDDTMAFVIEKKLKNVMTFYYLMKLDKKVPTDRKFIRKRQGKKVHELMKCAYNIPFYRKRFDEIYSSTGFSDGRIYN